TQVGCEALRPAEQFLHADFGGDRHTRHGTLQEWSDALPVRWQLAKGEILRDALQAPGRTYRLEQPHHEAAAPLAVVTVGARVLEHRHAWQILDGLGDQVVVLGRLVDDVDAGERAELPGPHARAVDHHVGLDVAERGTHAGHPAARLQHPGGRYALDD